MCGTRSWRAGDIVRDGRHTRIEDVPRALAEAVAALHH